MVLFIGLLKYRSGKSYGFVILIIKSKAYYKLLLNKSYLPYSNLETFLVFTGILN